MDRRTIEFIESCRPGSDDLRDPQFADIANEVEQDIATARLYDQTQRQDARIVGAIDQVPVPTGLAERILAHLGEHGGAVDEVLEITTIPGAAPGHETRGARPRRHWIKAVVAAAATVLVALTISHFLRPAARPSLELVASQWLADLNAMNADWQSMTSAPASAPFPDGIVGSATGWCRLNQGTATAYRVTHPLSGSAVLFVSRVPSENLPGSPPTNPQSATGGQAVGFWKVGSRVYMLVVPGNARNYRAFLHSGPAPLA